MGEEEENVKLWQSGICSRMEETGKIPTTGK